VDVGVPVHGWHDQPAGPVCVAMGAVVQRSRSDLAHAAMKPIDGLHGCRWIKRRIAERPLRDVDERPQPVGHILIEGSVQSRTTCRVAAASSRPIGSPWTSKSGAPADTYSPRAGASSKVQPAPRARSISESCRCS
jgi:hypothetical protein